MSDLSNTPTVVLVHGAFADSSYWVPVIEDLQAHDIPVLAPANPLRGLAHDAAYTASFVDQIDGPVLLVGHSYGGGVITEAGAKADNVVGLVYVAAFSLDEGEAFSEGFKKFGDTPILAAAQPLDYPLDGGGTAVELTLAPDRYKEAFAADLSDEQVRVLAVRQRPFADIFDDSPTVVAWKSLPCWSLVTTEDNAIPPESQRFDANRMEAETVEVDASHSVALSQPAATAAIIRSAVEATSKVPA